MKGVSLEQGAIVVLALDGTMVYVEVMEPMFAGVVALPDQPTERADDRVFTPGRVGIKKISPFSSFDKKIAVGDLSERNKTFIGTYEKLRELHGANFVDRTPEEEAAHVAAQTGPVKKVKKTPEERAAAKKVGPKFLQRCTSCGEQSGHPNHGDGDGQHVFLAPAPPAPLCAACDEPESDPVHAKEKADGGHKFIAGQRVKAPRAEKAPRADKPAKAPKEKATRNVLDPAKKFKWVGTDQLVTMLGAMNPKYKAGNSGAAICEAIKGSPDGLSVHDLAALLAGHEKWAGVSLERLTVAFTQLLAGGLIA